jgi:hypothetical protein
MSPAVCAHLQPRREDILVMSCSCQPLVVLGMNTRAMLARIMPLRLPLDYQLLNMLQGLQKHKIRMQRPLTCASGIFDYA